MQVFIYLICWCVWGAILYPWINTTEPEHSSQRDELFQRFFDHQTPISQEPKLEEVKAGMKKLEQLKEKHTNPYDLGQQLLKELDYAYEFNESRPNLISTTNPFENKNKEELMFPLDHELTVGQNYQMSLGIVPKQWMPVKGKWKVIHFVKHVSPDPDAVLPDHLPFEAELKEALGLDSLKSSSASGSKNIYSEYSFQRHIQLDKVGVWLLQAHYYPDNLMAQSADGVHVSEIEVLRVRPKKEGE